MIRVLVFAAIVVFAAAPAGAQRLVGSLSDREISIDSTFSGERLTIFGNVEPAIESGAKSVDGPFDVIIVVSGPAVDRVARRKTRELGIWLNTSQLVFKSFPSFFWVLSSSRLEDIANRDLLADEGILPETRPQLAILQGSGDPQLFGPELVRLMTEKGLFGIEEYGVQFQSSTLYSARMLLPADVPNGSFLAHTFLFKNGALVSERAEGFSVRKTGFERLLGTSAQTHPWAYGLAAVALAIFTGWLGGVVFRR